MTRQPRRRPMSPRRAGCLVACLVLAAATGHGPPVSAADRDAAPSILDPVPIDAAGPVDVESRVARGPADGGVLLVGGALLVAALFVRFLPRRGGHGLPDSVFAVLGEAPLAGTHTVRIVRFGPKTVLLGMTASTCTTLAEIDDAGVTAALVDECRAADLSSTVRHPAPRRLPSMSWAVLGRRAGGVS